MNYNTLTFLFCCAITAFFLVETALHIEQRLRESRAQSAFVDTPSGRAVCLERDKRCKVWIDYERWQMIREQCDGS